MPIESSTDRNFQKPGTNGIQHSPSDFWGKKLSGELSRISPEENRKERKSPSVMALALLLKQIHGEDTLDASSQQKCKNITLSSGVFKAMSLLLSIANSVRTVGWEKKENQSINQYFLEFMVLKSTLGRDTTQNVCTLVDISEDNSQSASARVIIFLLILQ